MKLIVLISILSVSAGAMAGPETIRDCSTRLEELTGRPLAKGKPFELSTVRLKIKPLGLEALKAVSKILLDDQVQEMSGSYIDEYDVWQVLNKSRKIIAPEEHNKPRIYILGAFLNDQLVGVAGLNFQRVYPKYSVGPSKMEAVLSYSLLPVFWGQGIASELATELMRFSFVTMKADIFMASALISNSASNKILKKIGLKPGIYYRQNIMSYSLKRDAYFKANPQD